MQTTTQTGSGPRLTRADSPTVDTQLGAPPEFVIPPVGSAAHSDGQDYDSGSKLTRMAAPHLRGFRVLCAVVFLVPLLYLLLRVTPDLLGGRMILWYGFAVLFSTVSMFTIAYGWYTDPSERRAYRGKRTDPPALVSDPTVTLMVAVMNEIDVIERCVQSMVKADYPNLEVIVVDDCSTDGTAEKLEALQSRYDFRFIKLTQNVGKKNALVTACQHATGEVLAFTDSDCIIAPDALGRCVEALHRDQRLGAVSGHGRALNANESFLATVQDTWYEGSFRVSKASESVFGVVNCVSGPLAVFRREAIWNYLPAWANDRFMGAPFKFATDRQLTGYVLGQKWKGQKLKDQYSDSAFVTDVDYKPHVWRVGYVQSARVWTVVPETRQAFMKQQIRWKKSFFRNLFFTGSFIWRRGVAASLLYYGHAAWVGLAPIMALRHLVIAPVQGLWLLTLLYVFGVMIKGLFWGGAYLIDHPGSTRWRYRPMMSLISSVVLSWLLPYSVATIRRGTWARGQK